MGPRIASLGLHASLLAIFLACFWFAAGVLAAWSDSYYGGRMPPRPTVWLRALQPSPGSLPNATLPLAAGGTLFVLGLRRLSRDRDDDRNRQPASTSGNPVLPLLLPRPLPLIVIMHGWALVAVYVAIHLAAASLVLVSMNHEILLPDPNHLRPVPVRIGNSLWNGTLPNVLLGAYLLCLGVLARRCWPRRSQT